MELPAIPGGRRPLGLSAPPLARRSQPARDRRALRIRTGRTRVRNARIPRPPSDRRPRTPHRHRRRHPLHDPVPPPHANNSTDDGPCPLRPPTRLPRHRRGYPSAAAGGSTLFSLSLTLSSDSAGSRRRTDRRRAVYHNNVECMRETSRRHRLIENAHAHIIYELYEIPAHTFRISVCVCVCARNTCHSRPFARFSLGFCVLFMN